MVTEYTRQYLLGFVWAAVLGDGCLTSLKRYPKENPKTSYPTRPKHSQYQIKQVEPHLDYIEWQAERLSALTQVKTQRVVPGPDPRGYNPQPRWELKTKVHPLYTQVRERAYLPDGSRTIDPHMLKRVTVEHLAMLYQDQGWLELPGGIQVRVGIATHRYSWAENKLLRDALAERFGFHFDVARQKAKSGSYHFYLRSSKDNARRFLAAIEAHVMPSFEYKLTGRVAPSA